MGIKTDISKMFLEQRFIYLCASYLNYIKKKMLETVKHVIGSIIGNCLSMVQRYESAGEHAEVSAHFSVLHVLSRWQIAVFFSL